MPLVSEILLEIVFRLLGLLLEALLQGVLWGAEKAAGNPRPGTRRERFKVKVQAKRARLRSSSAHRLGRCLLCREKLGPEALLSCPRCRADVHAECARELSRDRGCPTFACPGTLQPSGSDEEGRPPAPRERVAG